MSKLYTFRLMSVIGVIVLIYGACSFEANDASIIGFITKLVIGVALCAPCYVREIVKHENKSK